MIAEMYFEMHYDHVGARPLPQSCLLAHMLLAYITPCLVAVQILLAPLVLATVTQSMMSRRFAALRKLGLTSTTGRDSSSCQACRVGTQVCRTSRVCFSLVVVHTMAGHVRQDPRADSRVPSFHHVMSITSAKLHVASRCRRACMRACTTSGVHDLSECVPQARRYELHWCLLCLLGPCTFVAARKRKVGA
jgi:hypothetical protein